MRARRVLPVLLFAAIATAVAAAAVPQTPAPFTVHEWGTFTSVAGADGQAVRWLPQNGPVDLPCFVEHNPLQFKGSLSGTVRMETPVLYFYAQQPLETSVRVGFPQGYLSEWYPHATVTTGATGVTTNGTIAWPSVQVAPGTAGAYPRESGASHYYAARATDASPLLVAAQPEKFLFYRGVGQFQPPLTAIARDDGSVAVRSTAGAPIGDVIYFERRGGALTFTSRHAASAEVLLARPSLDDASGAPLAELKKILVANGLYPREAQAMVDTWKDSWFEEGARLLYVVPRADVDAILPLSMSPGPAALARVFVGRIELMTPATLRDVKAAVTSRDRRMLTRYGRFLLPIAGRAGLTLPVDLAATLADTPVPTCR
ncbi:MAG TPA: hypothetical protein VGI12_03635 [Vicinamibacterales bacterium]|jgi:hypothetical protein